MVYDAGDLIEVGVVSDVYDDDGNSEIHRTVKLSRDQLREWGRQLVAIADEVQPGYWVDHGPGGGMSYVLHGATEESEE